MFERLRLLSPQGCQEAEDNRPGERGEHQKRGGIEGEEQQEEEGGGGQQQGRRPRAQHVLCSILKLRRGTGEGL